MSLDNTNHNDTEQAEVQAKQIARLLDAHAQRLSMRTLKKLDDGRNRAVKLHQQHGATMNADGSLSHWTSWVDHHRLAFAGLILVAIVATFILLQNGNGNETSDAFLLGADLPPEAFVDKGFEPSLNNRTNI